MKTAITRNLPRVAAVLAALMVAAFGLAAWSLYSSHQDACDARDKNLNVTHAILMYLEPDPAALAKLPAAQRKRIASFYTFSYAQIAQARC